MGGQIHGGVGSVNNIVLPSITWNEQHTHQPIEPNREFMLVLRQGLLPETTEKFLKALEAEYVSFDLRYFNVQMAAADNANMTARLPLWDGISIRRRDDVFTGRIIMASMNVTLAPVTAVATGSTSGKADD